MRPLSLALVVVLAGCSSQDQGVEKDTRSDVVTGTATTASKPAPTTAPSESATSEAPKRKLCSSSNRVEKDLPKVKFGKIDESTTIGEGSLETGSGMWTWINVWAGWCGPCRAEVPLLLKLRERFAKDLTPARIEFVSIDDDDREARKFVASSNMKETLYLSDGKDRSKFMEALGSTGGTALPIQIFVDPHGSIRCIAHGEVTEADYAEIAAMFTKK